jgi:hypothetical protein
MAKKQAYKQIMTNSNKDQSRDADNKRRVTQILRAGLS